MTVATKNQNEEQIARDAIDKRLSEAGWLVQDKKSLDFNAGRGIASDCSSLSSGVMCGQASKGSGWGSISPLR